MELPSSKVLVLLTRAPGNRVFSDERVRAGWEGAVSVTRMPSGVHLVGSVSLDSAEDVFRAVSSLLGDRVRRIPDGETGGRGLFTLWQSSVFAGHPDFEQSRDRKMLRVVPPYELRAGADAGRLRFEQLGYAQAARESYQVFKRLREEGVIPAGIRFQVSLPTPPNTLSLIVAERDAGAVAPAYEAALLAEVDEILRAVPPEDLAIQWDAPYEVRAWDGRVPAFMGRPWFGDVRETIVDGLRRLGEHVPEPAELGYHLCHGDYEHTGNLFFRLRGSPRSKFVRRAGDMILRELGRRVAGPPKDATAVTEMASALAHAVGRRIDFVHLPVPRDARDRYFAPLASLALQPGTELYLGLVHYTDGQAGTMRRIEAAQRVVAGFGLATECGWGRRDQDTIRALLELHRDLSAPVDAPSLRQ